MKVLYDLEDMLEAEIKKITKKEELDTACVDLAYKMVDIIKDIETIGAMRGTDEGYSRSDGTWMNGGSYDMGNRVYNDGSYAMRRNGDTGRYMRSYSRNGEHEHMVHKLERMMDEATDESVRRAIQKSINELKG